jgi:hypothetical protein
MTVILVSKLDFRPDLCTIVRYCLRSAISSNRRKLEVLNTETQVDERNRLLRHSIEEGERSRS